MVKAKKRWAKRIAAVALACALGTGAVGALVGCSPDSKSNSDEMSVAWTSNAGEYNLDPTNNYMGWQGSYLGSTSSCSASMPTSTLSPCWLSPPKW